MSSTNLVILMGNLCKDLSSGVTKNGKAWAKSVIAVDNWNFTEKKVTDTIFIPVWFYEGNASTAISLLQKGTRIFLTGRLASDNYTKKDGTEINGLKISAASYTIILRGKPKDQQVEAAKDIAISEPAQTVSEQDDGQDMPF